MMQIFKKILFCLSLLFFTSSAFALTPDKTAGEALKFYQIKDYGQAIAKWELLKNYGFGGALADYNIGNAYFRMGKLGYAKAYWLKAEREKPRDEKVFHNLAYLKKLSLESYSDEEENALNRWLAKNYFRFRLNYREALQINLLLGILLSFPIFSYLFLRKSWAKKLSYTLAPFYCLSFILMAYLSYTQVYQNTGVALTELNLYEEPIESSQVLGKVKEGEEVKILDFEGEVLYLKSSSGQSGWVDRARILKI